MLTKGMFGNQFDSKSPRFGLHCGQMRGKQQCHNAGWYNKLGEKLGWGDLDEKDFQKISKELEADEIFIILSERASFWNFVEKVGMIGSMCKTNAKESEPGIDYMIENATWVIKPGMVYHISDYGYKGPWTVIPKSQLTKEFLK